MSLKLKTSEFFLKNCKERLNANLIFNHSSYNFFAGRGWGHCFFSDFTQGFEGRRTIVLTKML